MTALFTIGYEGRALDEFLELLAAALVDRVIDVRELPLSRRRGFSKTPLSGALAREGMEYVHLREAGNPFRRDKALTAEALLATYRAHLTRTPAAVRAVTEAARGHRAALLCFEADASTCHRSVLAPRVAKQLRVRVVHL